MRKRRFILNSWLAIVGRTATKVLNFRGRKIEAEAPTNGEPDGDEPGSGGKSDFDGDEGSPEIEVFGQIGQSYFDDEKGVCAEDFRAALAQVPRRVGPTVTIHSPGGNVWEAFAIHGMIRDRGNVTTRILGIAASSADVIFQAGSKRIMPKLSMRMAHNPSSLCMGDAEDMRAEADRLDKHGNALAAMYADRSGLSLDECKTIMHDESWMAGDESKAKGFCDELTDESPIQNKFDLSSYRRVPAAILNKATTAPQQNGAQTRIIMNRNEMIALLKSWGVPVANDVTDDWLKQKISEGRPAPAQTPPTAAATPPAAPANVVPLPPTAPQQPSAPAAAAAPASNGGQVVVDVLNQLQQIRDALAQSQQRETTERRNRITVVIDDLIRNDQIPAAQRDFAINHVVNDEAALSFYRALPSRPPGISPVSNISAVSDSMEDIDKGILTCRAPIASMLRGNEMRHAQGRQAIGNGAVQASGIIAKHSEKLLAVLCGVKRVETRTGVSYEPVGAPVMNDNPNYGGVTVSTDLQRQVIFSEAMRAFRRRLLSLATFAHTFQNVPLEGKDQVVVPYYPLYTTGSQRMTTKGYQFPAGGDQTLSKKITVGGLPTDNKTPGVDRAYQPMTWTAYLLRRQPWVDILKLAVMRTEQLAFDVLNDIITAWILRANFGNAAWAGLPGAFDETDVALIAGVCRKSDWPDGMRNLVIGTDYWVNLASSPYVKAYLNIGDTGTIRDGRIGGLYGFDDTLENPRIPATADGNLIGWASYPSALLVATAPIMPAPGEMKVMLNYDVIADPQIGLAFEYKYWGEPWNSADREIIECNYGSDLGELAALKRLVSNGN